MESSKIALVETAFFPPIEYLSKVVEYPSVYLEACTHFQKGSYRNRCHIATSRGIQVLSVPLKKGKNDKQLIRDVRIAYDVAWQKQHWQSLKTAYGSAPFWQHYAPRLEPFFQKEFPFLFDYNLEILQVVLKILKLEKTISLSFTGSYKPDYTEGVDFRKMFKPKTPIATTLRYSQVFEDRQGFMPNLSILDLIFCCGNQAMDILK